MAHGATSQEAGEEATWKGLAVRSGRFQARRASRRRRASLAAGVLLGATALVLTGDVLPSAPRGHSGSCAHGLRSDLPPRWRLAQTGHSRMVLRRAVSRSPWARAIPSSPQHLQVRPRPRHQLRCRELVGNHRHQPRALTQPRSSARCTKTPFWSKKVGLKSCHEYSTALEAHGDSEQLRGARPHERAQTGDTAQETSSAARASVAQRACCHLGRLDVQRTLVCSSYDASAQVLHHVGRDTNSGRLTVKLSRLRLWPTKHF